MDEAKAQELSDVREIIDVMNRYTTALDTRNWAMLEATMTPDGQADFGNLAGVGSSTARRPSSSSAASRCRTARDAAPARQLRVKVTGDTIDELLLQANHFQKACRAATGRVDKYRDDFVHRERLADQALPRHGRNMNLFAGAARLPGAPRTRRTSSRAGAERHGRSQSRVSAVESTTHARLTGPFWRKVVRLLDSYASLLALLLLNFFMLEPLLGQVFLVTLVARLVTLWARRPGLGADEAAP